MISQNNKPEILSFTYQEIYLARQLIQSRKHLILYLKFLSKKYGYPVNKIIFNHDFMDMSELQFSFINNFKKKGSYDYLKDELKNKRKTPHIKHHEVKNLSS